MPLLKKAFAFKWSGSLFPLEGAPASFTPSKTNSPLPYIWGQPITPGSATVKLAVANVIACGVKGTPILFPAVAVIVVMPQLLPEVARPLLLTLATPEKVDVQVT